MEAKVTRFLFNHLYHGSCRTPRGIRSTTAGVVGDAKGQKCSHAVAHCSSVPNLNEAKSSLMFSVGPYGRERDDRTFRSTCVVMGPSLPTTCRDFRCSWPVSRYPQVSCTIACYLAGVSFGAQCSAAARVTMVDLVALSICRVYSLSPSLFPCCR